MAKPFKASAVAAASAADEKKAEDITVLDVRDMSPVADYLIVATVHSRPQMEAVERKIEESLEALGRKALRRARPASDHWRVLDYGGFMVHLMSPEARALYALERLHPGAKKIPWC